MADDDPTLFDFEMTSEYALDFDDPTIIETDGRYDAVKALMYDELFVDPDDWMLKSKLVVSSYSGLAEFELNFYQNRKLYIVDYSASQSDVFYNTDLSVLSVWAQEAGWNIPRPHPDLIRARSAFWKHFWELGVIQSEYLDNLYPQEKDDEEIE